MIIYNIIMKDILMPMFPFVIRDILNELYAGYGCYYIVNVKKGLTKK